MLTGVNVLAGVIPNHSSKCASRHAMMSSSSVICALCRNCLVNKCDKNLVDALKSTAFNARHEILSLDIKIKIKSAHICRNCLILLKIRRYGVMGADRPAPLLRS